MCWGERGGGIKGRGRMGKLNFFSFICEGRKKKGKGGGLLKKETLPISYSL